MKITGIRIFPITLTVKPEYYIVSSAGKHAISRYVVIAIDTDDGVSGWGEATVVPLWSGESQGGVAALIQDYFAPLLVNRAPADVTNNETFTGGRLSELSIEEVRNEITRSELLNAHAARKS